MPKYLIPTHKLVELTKKISRIKNKNSNIIFTIGDPKQVKHIINKNKTIIINMTEIEVVGAYKVNGWHFVATIEHTEAGNIIRCVDTELELQIPSKYRTIGQECEHCHQVRDRRDTYLVYNEETKEFKQLGRTCLQSYTRGLDAAICAQISAAIYMCEEIQSQTMDEDELYAAFLSSSFSGSSPATLPTAEVKATAYAYVKQFGYTPKDTARELSRSLFGLDSKLDKDLPKASAEDLEPMDTWVSEIRNEYGYMANAKIAWTKASCEYRDVALIASLVGVYLKDKVERTKKALNRNNVYVGEVGSKVTITNIKSIRVIYSSINPYIRNFESYIYTYEIIDGLDQTYIWATAHEDLDEDYVNIEKITAIVKKHNEHRGTKQTVITRGKIIWKTPDKKEVNLPEYIEPTKASNVIQVLGTLNTIED